MRMIILAAGQGTRLRPLTDSCPKCMVPLAGTPLLDWQIQTARSVGINDIVVVGGYRAEQLPRPHVRVVINETFASTNMVHSLFCAEPFFGSEFIVSYGDIVYTRQVLETLIQHAASISVVVDSRWRHYWETRFADPLADAESLRLDENGMIQNIGQPVSEITEIQGQYIGLLKFQREGVDRLGSAYEAAQQDEAAGRLPFSGKRTLAGLYMTDLLQGMIDRGDQLAPAWIERGWFEIDSIDDLREAEAGWEKLPRKAG